MVLLVLTAAAPGAAQAALSWSGPVAVDQSGTPGLRDVACPSASQCTAVDGIGREVTFDPGSGAAPSPVVVDPGQVLSAVACPSVTQCTAVEPGPFNGYQATGREVTFDPQSPADHTAAQIGDAFLGDVVCPSTSECVTVGQDEGCGGDEVTFNPLSPGSATADRIDQANQGCPVGHFNNIGPALAVA